MATAKFSKFADILSEAHIMPTCQQPSARSLGDGIKSTRRLKVNWLIFLKLIFSFFGQGVVDSWEFMLI